MPTYYDENTKSWYCKFYYTDYTGTRKQKKKRGFKLQRDAKEWERTFLERMQGTPDMTFQALYDAYVEDMNHRLRASSVNTRKCILENRALPYFKDKPINTITAMDIRKWEHDVMALNYSDAYLYRIWKELSIMFNFAVKYYNLPSNPCVKAGSMGKPTRSMNFWTIEQYNQIMEYVNDITIKTVLQLLFYSGMRKGELFALTYADFDFQANTINITKSLQHKASGDLITPPKTDNGIRCISMPQAIMDEIKGYCGKIYGLSDNDIVFPVYSNKIKREMKRCAALADVPLIRIHDLRHSHVSLLIDMGFTPLLIAERIGDTVQMVNNTYGHLYPARHQEVANKLNDLIVPK